MGKFQIRNIGDITIRKALIFILLISLFFNGYLYCFRFEILGIVIDIFRIMLLICLTICLYMILKKQWNIAPLVQKSSLFLEAHILCMIILAAFWIVLGKSVEGAASELIAIVINLFYFFCLSLCININKEIWQFTVNVFKYIGIIIGIISYFEIIWGFELPSSRFNDIVYCKPYTFHPATAFFANENNLAAMLLVVCAIIIIQALYSGKIKDFAIHLAQLTVVLIPITMSESTLFRLGLFIIVISSIIIMFIVKKAGKAMLLKSASLIGCVFFFTIALKENIKWFFIKCNLALYHSNSNFNFEQLTKISSGDSFIEQINYSGMGTFEIRKNLFFYGIDAMKKNPVCGNGPNSFADIFQSNVEYTIKTADVVNPHNYIVELMVQYGLLITIAFIILCVFIMYVTIKHMKKSESYGAVLCFVLLIAFAISTVMPSTFLKWTIYQIPLYLIVIGVDVFLKDNKYIEENSK